MKYNKKLFISFEGPEASGKSSQINLLSSFLKSKKIPHIITREPWGTKIAENLRKIILSKKDKISNIEEILLLMASRANHIEKIIKPALKQGKIVISDRFADSTFVYQGYVNKFGLKKLTQLHKEILDNFLPSKTFLLLLSPNEINKRLKKRKISNKYDLISYNFHKKVLDGYKTLSRRNKRFIILNANQSKNIIHQTIIENILI